MKDVSEPIVDKLSILCKKIDQVYDSLDPGQTIGIMMDGNTKLFVLHYFEKSLNYPKNSVIATITTCGNKICPIVVNDDMPLFGVKACIIQPINL